VAKSDIAVFLRLVGQRKFAKEVAAAGAELEAMGLKGAKAMSVFASKGEALKKFGRSWTRNVSLPVALLGGYAVKSAADFKRQMGLIATDAGGTAKEVGVLEKSVLGLTRQTQYGPTQLAEALFHVESAGYRGAKAMKVLHESARLATAGNSDLEQTTYALVSANKALNEGESLKGITKTAGQLNEIVAHGDIRLEELTAAMSTGLLPTAKALGLGVADVGSALDIMTARGIPAQRSAYALNFTLQKLVPSTEKAEKAFKRLGIGEEELLKTAQKKGLPWALERLKQAMHGLSKGKEVQTIDEMFGGGRMSKGLLVVIQHLSEAKEKFHEVNGDVALYNKHVKEAEEQPLVKLKTAWSGIQAVLVELGGTALPLVVPGLERLASAGEAALHAFVGLPGPVQASIAGFLLLTGPVASGLGYFASGIGRALILTRKLATAGETLSIFSTAMQSGQGLGGSASMAFGGVGESAALQTVKGFAYSLGPAVAAYGIGNILTSALSNDWRDAGFEAGGAIAGGIAGFMVGGPLGAMFGAGIGSLGGELLSGLFKSTPRLSLMRRETQHLESALTGYGASVEHLAHVEHREERTHNRHIQALKREREARRHLAQVLARYGVDSTRATRAQRRLSEAERAVTRSGRAEERMHRLAGFRLKEFRIQSLHAVASVKQLLPVQRKRIKAMREEVNHGRTGIKFLNELEGIEQRVGKEKRKLTAIYGEAEEKAGKPWASRLQQLTSLQAKYGSKGNVLVEAAGKARTKMHELTQAGLKQTTVWQEAREELAKYNHLLENFTAQTEGLGPRSLNPTPPGGHNHRVPGGGGRVHPQNHKSGARGGHVNAGRQRLPRLTFSGDHVFHLEVTNHNVLELDGKTAAESTTRQTKRAANRQ
jgi:TP901 family phage tail tape measure protein